MLRCAPGRPTFVSTTAPAFRPAGDAPRDLAQQIAGKLEAWTGQRWLVSIDTDSEGEPTLAEQWAAARAPCIALESKWGKPRQ